MKIKKSKIHILVVEDSETSAMLIQSIFEENKLFHVEIAKTAKIASNILKKQNFDLILLDLMLPKIDGFTFLKELKKDINLKNIPVVIVSALNNSENIRKSKHLGAIAFITKPIGKNKLFEKIIMLLKENYNF